MQRLASPMSTSSHRQSSCDNLLHSDTDQDDDFIQVEGLLGQSPHLDDLDPPPPARPRPSTALSMVSLQKRAAFTRYLALLCACFLSVGSHYASYVLGPLKSRLSRELGTSHTEFSLLVSAFSLNSTWTPLVGGILATTLGTTVTSIMATGVIFLGIVLLLIGDILGDVKLMALGMFIFGLGVSPVAVVQETIIVRFFKSHGLGVSMAFGLIVGKGASFVSARTSYPLTEAFGPRAPFYVAAGLAGLAVVVNLTYIATSRWLIDGAMAELEASDIHEEAIRRSVVNLSEAEALEKVAKKRMVHIKEITTLGDVFWAYIGLNVLCGMLWSPFTHLAANIIEIRYQMMEQDAANMASYLLAGSLILYPICGFLVDRYKARPIVLQLLILSSSLTLLTYVWLASPPEWTHTPKPAIAAFAVGHGFSPLLLVVLVPKIVSLKYVSTALGVHKSLEQTGSTIFQTVAGLVLDKQRIRENARTTQQLLNVFVFVNILQTVAIVGLWVLQIRQQKAVVAEPPIPNDPERRRLLTATHSDRRYSAASRTSLNRVRHNPGVRRRGKIFMIMSIVLIVFAWVLFMTTAWLKLGKKRHDN